MMTMNKVKQRLIGAAVFAFGILATHAVPISYQGILQSGVEVVDSVSSASVANNPAFARYWTFFGNSGDRIVIAGHRLEGGLDPAFWLYAGVFSDTSEFNGDLNSGPGLLAFGDDQLAANTPGPFGDAGVSMLLPVTGQYTIAFVNFGNSHADGGDGQFGYSLGLNIVNPSALNIVTPGVISAVPEVGSTVGLLLLGFLGLIIARLLSENPVRCQWAPRGKKAAAIADTEGQ
jgi:hypothetical protein